MSRKYVLLNTISVLTRCQISQHSENLYFTLFRPYLMRNGARRNQTELDGAKLFLHSHLRRFFSCCKLRKHLCLIDTGRKSKMAALRIKQYQSDKSQGCEVALESNSLGELYSISSQVIRRLPKIARAFGIPEAAARSSGSRRA